MRAIPDRKNKKPFRIFLDKAVHRTLKVYATETEQTMLEILKEPIAQLEQDAIKIVSQIEEMKSKALEEKLREEENKKIAESFPIVVSGHKEDPIGNIEKDY